MDSTGRVAVVTGAGRGLRPAPATALAAAAASAERIVTRAVSAYGRLDPPPPG